MAERIKNTDTSAVCATSFADVQASHDRHSGNAYEIEEMRALITKLQRNYTRFQSTAQQKM